MSKQPEDTAIWIAGPPLASRSKVINTLYALHYLPENYKLVLSGSVTADQDFVTEITSLVRRDNLEDRVQFASDAPPVQVIRLPDKDMSSPEAVASIILDSVR